MTLDPNNFPLLIPCVCGRVVMVTGDGADLVRLVESKNELVRECERLRGLLNGTVTCTT